MDVENNPEEPKITWERLKQLVSTMFYDRTIHRGVSDKTDDGYEMNVWDASRDDEGKLRSVEFRMSKRFLYKGHPILVVARKCYYDETVIPPKFQEIECEFECPSGKTITVKSSQCHVMEAVQELIEFVEKGIEALPHDFPPEDAPVDEDAVYKPIKPCPKCGCNIVTSEFSISIVKPAMLVMRCVKCGHQVLAKFGGGDLIKNWNEWKEETD